MTRDRAGWQGKLELVPPAPEVLAAFDAALRFQPYQCKNKDRRQAAAKKKKAQETESDV